MGYFGEVATLNYKVFYQQFKPSARHDMTEGIAIKWPFAAPI